MSCYMVDEGHVRFLVAAALQYGSQHFRWFGTVDGEVVQMGELVSEPESADACGLMLLEACALSVRTRYPNDSHMEPGTVAYRHPFTLGGPIEAVQVLKAVACYEYQACEAREWEGSSAHAFCEALRHYAIPHLPGYDDAEWGVPAAWCRPIARVLSSKHIR